MKRVKITVFGHVQGVYYRYFAKIEATKLGLTGWAKNKDDGSVYLVVEGQSGAVASFISWAKEGPMLARVDKLEVNEEESENGEGEFEIR